MRRRRFHTSVRPPEVEIAPGCPLDSARFLSLGLYPGTTLYRDSSGYGNHGTLTNMDPASDWVYAPELGRVGMLTDGVDGYTEIQNSAPLRLQQVSLACWAKFTDGSRFFQICGNYDNPAKVGYKIAVEGGSGKAYSQCGTGTSGPYILTPWSMNDGLWHHYLLMVSSGLQMLYIDGAPLPSVSTSALAISNAPFRIGRNSDEINLGSVAVADVAVWASPRTPDEITTLASPDPMYGGWLLPRSRKSFPVAVAGPSFNPAWASGVNRLVCGNQLIGGGLC